MQPVAPGAWSPCQEQTSEWRRAGSQSSQEPVIARVPEASQHVREPQCQMPAAAARAVRRSLPPEEAGHTVCPGSVAPEDVYVLIPGARGSLHGERTCYVVKLRKLSNSVKKRKTPTKMHPRATPYR